jgi:hypothetical protein
MRVTRSDSEPERGDEEGEAEDDAGEGLRNGTTFNPTAHIAHEMSEAMVEPSHAFYMPDATRIS